ncbi:MAG: sigma-70 family RNA polymerase sigma factor [Chloroflexota bacterium]|nr:MAG: RNA polymerase subunit sigma-24 [Chloroflexota bacterium]
MQSVYLPEDQLHDEAALIEVARRGDLSAFNALVLRYQNIVYTVAYRIMGDQQSASDATQEAFISAFRRLSTFRGGSFRSWLLRITANACYDELRRLKRRPATSLEELPSAESDDGPSLPDDTDTPEEVIEQSELRNAIQQCIQALGEDQRTVMVLSDVDGLSYQEIADVTGANLGTIKSRLSRARAAVRDCLQAVQELLPSAYRLMDNE